MSDIISDSRKSAMDSKTLFVQPDGAPSTFADDENLPSLPLPTLEGTLDRYYESLRPFGSEEELANSRRIIDEFRNGIGKRLHSIVEERARKERNWLERWWEEHAYLTLRFPLMPSGNMVASMLLEHAGADVSEAKMLRNLAQYVKFTFELWQLIRDEKLKPQMSADGKTKFSHSQFRRLYNTCRIPGEEKDDVKCWFKTTREGHAPTELIFTGRGKIFALNAFDKDGRPLTVQQIYRALQMIWASIHEGEDGHAVPALTMDERGNWAKNRAYLVALSENNRELLERVESSIAFFIFDDRHPRDDTEVVQKTMAANPSVWADKGCCVIAFANGKFGCFGEHSCYDATVSILATLWHLVRYTEQPETDYDAIPDSVVVPIELKFEVDDRIKSEIARLKVVIEENQTIVQTPMFNYTKFGKAYIKELRIHPDSFVQMALQLAYYRMHKKLVATYETALMRSFYNGRTETVRSVSTDVVELVNVWSDPHSSSANKARVFRRAAETQTRQMTEARKGNGIDRHLFGLWCAAFEAGLPVPELYEDPLYAKSGGGGNFVLSTSTLGFTMLTGCVAPMVMDGYGLFYSTPNDDLWFMVTAYRASSETSAERFVSVLDGVLDELRIVMEETKNSVKL